MLHGLMQDDQQLTLGAIRRRLEACFADGEVVDYAPGGSSRRSYGELSARVHRLGHALERLGVSAGDRVATFAWNSADHVELYLGIPSAGAVLHTVNLRLPGEQIRFVIDHGGAEVLFVDARVAPLLAPAVPGLAHVKTVVICGGDPADDHGIPGSVSYEELLADSPAEPFAWPELDERAAAALCYTSGTTGDPKGVLYSHRSLALHSTVACLPDVMALGQDSRVVAIVPQFHANAWGLVFAAAICGASLLMPGPHLQGEPVADLCRSERATLVAGVPTVLGGLVDHCEQAGEGLGSVTRALCGGSAVPRKLMERYDALGVEVRQAWGMTETSPLGSVAAAPAHLEGEDRWAMRTTAGRIGPWVEARLAGDDGALRPHDGRSVGELQVRGPWIASAYYERPDVEANTDDGWLHTGDVASIDERGVIRISDRTKDLVKSGGEWISSVDVENLLMSADGVAEAAVIAMPDERWDERPLACVALQEGSELDTAALREHLSTELAKWQLPDAFAVVAEVPKTSVGKYDKKVLRRRLADGELEVVRAQSAAG